MAQLRQILESPLFCNSRRYPAFLEFVVRETLAGNTDKLKERMIGIEVFHRAPDYDSNAEPVVRVTAAEVRKRIAQFYHDPTRAHDLRIDLSAGSYVAEFRSSDAEWAPDQKSMTLPDSTVNSPQVSRFPVSAIVDKRNIKLRLWRTTALALIVFFIVLSTVALVCWRLAVNASMAHSAMWEPLIQPSKPIVLLVGEHIVMPEQIHPDESIYTLPHVSRIYSGDAIVLAHLVGMLEANHAQCKILGSKTAPLSDFRNAPVILIGAFNNPWTLRFLAPLRFSFADLNPPGSVKNTEMMQVTDKENPSNTRWSVDNKEPLGSLSRDYAIIGRFHEETTDSMAVVVAGIGARATEGAAEFVTSPDYMHEFDRSAPKNWRKMNMEAVIEVEVIDGRAGHPHVVATKFW